MTRKNWIDLVIGITMIAMSAWLWFNESYTYEIAIIIALLTMMWLITD